MEDEAVKTGLIGDFKGWRVGGKSFDPDGNEIEEKHEDDCFCCRRNLLTPKQ